MNTPQPKSSWKTWHKVVLTIIGSLLLMLGYIINKDSKPQAKPQEQNLASQPKEVKVENWKNQEDIDKMTSKKNYYTSTVSTNTIEFKFPYAGGSNFFLSVRNVDGNTDVMLEVSKGQFISSIGYDDRSIKLKFDNEAPFNVGYNGASDGSSKYIFLGSAKKIISKLKTAKKLMIEAEFYDEGSRVIEFDVAGFNWQH